MAEARPEEWGWLSVFAALAMPRACVLVLRSLTVQTVFKPPQLEARLVQQLLMVRERQLVRMERALKAPMHREVEQALQLPQAMQFMMTGLMAAAPPVLALSKGRELVEPEVRWGALVDPPPLLCGTTWIGPRTSRSTHGA